MKRITTAAEVIGAGLITVGVAKFSDAAGYIVAGLVLWAYSWKIGGSE